LTRRSTRAGARVLALARRKYALETARVLGAAELVAIGNPRDTIERVHELTEGRGCERVIEATGRQAPLDLASELTRERGRLVIAGYHQDGPRTVNMQLWNWRGLRGVNAPQRGPPATPHRLPAGVAAQAPGRPGPPPPPP